MLKADSATVTWDSQKKTWRVKIQVGEEVIKRPATEHKIAKDATDEALRSLAVETAHGDGYEVDPNTVTIAR